MRSGRRGESTLVAEVANVSANGFWLLLDEQELFVPFKQFPGSARPQSGSFSMSNGPTSTTSTGRISMWTSQWSQSNTRSATPLVSKARPNIALQRPGHTSRPVRSRATRQVARR